MKKIIAIAMLLAAGCCGLAQAQVRKCTGPDGRVTYSDFVCGANTVRETGVNTNNNTLDASGMREDAQRSRSQDAVAQAQQQGAGRCRFSYFELGDSKGKALAADAKAECLSNLSAKALGQPTSLEAYDMWKDHSTQKSSERQNAGNRASAAASAQANAQAIANATSAAISAAGRQNADKSFKCKKSLYEKFV